MAEATVKELISDWILITYDIPAKEKKLRREFLKKAGQLGAEQHTDSCYYMPYSEKAMEMANQLQAAGHAIIWGPVHQPNKEKTKAILFHYEQHLVARCDFIEQRLVAAQSYIVAGRFRFATKMGIKTGKLLAQLAAISQNYKVPWLAKRLSELVVQWKETHGKQADNHGGAEA